MFSYVLGATGVVVDDLRQSAGDAVSSGQRHRNEAAKRRGHEEGIWLMKFPQPTNSKKGVKTLAL